MFSGGPSREGGGGGGDEEEKMETEEEVTFLSLSHVSATSKPLKNYSICPMCSMCHLLLHLKETTQQLKRNTEEEVTCPNLSHVSPTFKELSNICQRLFNLCHVHLLFD